MKINKQITLSVGNRERMGCSFLCGCLPMSYIIEQ